MFLTVILPYLNLKKAEAELAIEFQSTKESVTWAREMPMVGTGIEVDYRGKF